jgi:hypothetical protein
VGFYRPSSIESGGDVCIAKYAFDLMEIAVHIENPKVINDINVLTDLSAGNGVSEACGLEVLQKCMIRDEIVGIVHVHYFPAVWSKNRFVVVA